jgi:hypothetical protein
MDISNMIFGIDLRQGIGKEANAGRIGASMFMTPKSKTEMISAEAQRKKAMMPASSSSRKGS